MVSNITSDAQLRNFSETELVNLEKGLKKERGEQFELKGSSSKEHEYEFLISFHETMFFKTNKFVQTMVNLIE